MVTALSILFISILILILIVAGLFIIELKKRVVTMYVCEINHLILHPNQLYIFIQHPDCEACKKYLEGK